MKKIIILIPVYNDWESLKKLLLEINENIKAIQNISFNCFVVNDSSTIRQPELKKPPKVFDCLAHVFQNLLDHEIEVTKKINKVVDLCLKHKDYTTHNFMQWYVAEQIEEEALERTILDKLKLIGVDKGGLYLFDRDILQIKISEE